MPDVPGAADVAPVGCQESIARVRACGQYMVHGKACALAGGVPALAPAAAVALAFGVDATVGAHRAMGRSNTVNTRSVLPHPIDTEILATRIVAAGGRGNW